MSEASKRTENRELARSSLPIELVPVRDVLVTVYSFAASIHQVSPFFSYVVTAENVKVGMRLTGKPIGIWKSTKADQSKVSGEE